MRPFRLELAKKVGSEAPLLGLIRVYKDYYPDVIVGEAGTGRIAVFGVRSACIFCTKVDHV